MTAKEMYKLQYIHDAYHKHEVQTGYCKKCMCNVINGKSIHNMTSPIVMFRLVFPGIINGNSFETDYLAVMIARYCKATDERPEIALQLNASDNPALTYYGQKPIEQDSISKAIKIANDLLEDK